jgi:hypothetical protein
MLRATDQKTPTACAAAKCRSDLELRSPLIAADYQAAARESQSASVSKLADDTALPNRSTGGHPLSG